jgi:hypothetical protein
MKISGSYREEDLTRALKLFQSRSILSETIVGIIYASILGYFLYRLLSMDEFPFALTDILLIGLIAGVALWWFYILPNKWKSYFRKNNVRELAFEMELDENGVFANNRQIPWQGFVKSKEDDDLILLYRSTANENAIILPKRYLVEPAMRFLREKLLANSIPDARPVDRRNTWIAIVLFILAGILTLTWYPNFLPSLFR